MRQHPTAKITQRSTCMRGLWPIEHVSDAHAATIAPPNRPQTCWALLRTRNCDCSHDVGIRGMVLFRYKNADPARQQVGSLPERCAGRRRGLQPQARSRPNSDIASMHIVRAKPVDHLYCTLGPCMSSQIRHYPVKGLCTSREVLQQPNQVSEWPVQGSLEHS